MLFYIIYYVDAFEADYIKKGRIYKVHIFYTFKVYCSERRAFSLAFTLLNLDTYIYIKYLD